MNTYYYILLIIIIIIIIVNIIIITVIRELHGAPQQPQDPGRAGQVRRRNRDPRPQPQTFSKFVFLMYFD